jgi:hypothetical protein
MTTEAVTVEGVPCARHHNIITYLRCGRCGTPICPKCLVHTPVGARCPDCASPLRSIGGLVKPWAYPLSLMAGLGVGMFSGIALSLLQFPFLTWIAQMLTGFLVGEVVSAVGNRQRTTGLAIIAFTAAVLGPPLGTALFFTLTMPVGIPPTLLVVGVIQAMGPIGWLLLLLAGVIASTRVKN